MTDIAFSSANFWYLLNFLQHKFIIIPSFIKDTSPFPSHLLQRCNNAKRCKDKANPVMSSTLPLYP